MYINMCMYVYIKEPLTSDPNSKLLGAENEMLVLFQSSHLSATVMKYLRQLLKKRFYYYFETGSQVVQTDLQLTQ